MSGAIWCPVARRGKEPYSNLCADAISVVISSAFWGVSSVHEGAFSPRRWHVIYSGVITVTTVNAGLLLGFRRSLWLVRGAGHEPQAGPPGGEGHGALSNPYEVSGENGAVATTVLGPRPGPTLATGRQQAPASPLRSFWAALRQLQAELGDPVTGPALLLALHRWSTTRPSSASRFSST